MNILKMLNDSYQDTKKRMMYTVSEVLEDARHLNNRMDEVKKIAKEFFYEAIATAEDVVSDLDVVRQAHNEQHGYVERPHTLEDVENQVAFITATYGAASFVYKLHTGGDVAMKELSSAKNVIEFADNISTITGKTLDSLPQPIKEGVKQFREDLEKTAQWEKDGKLMEAYGVLSEDPIIKECKITEKHFNSSAQLARAVKEAFTTEEASPATMSI